MKRDVFETKKQTNIFETIMDDNSPPVRVLILAKFLIIKLKKFILSRNNTSFLGDVTLSLLVENIDKKLGHQRREMT